MTEKQEEVINVLRWMKRAVAQEYTRTFGGVRRDALDEDYMMLSRLIESVANWEEEG